MHKVEEVCGEGSWALDGVEGQKGDVSGRGEVIGGEE